VGLVWDWFGMYLYLVAFESRVRKLRLSNLEGKGTVLKIDWDGRCAAFFIFFIKP
jgi:hypothetical protein